jgi:hypothetical protein
MAWLLFPGRHHLLSNFQLEYLTLATEGDPATLPDVDGHPLGRKDRFDTILWAITSANHAHTRRNPLPGHRREAAIEDFASALAANSYVFHIDDLGPSCHFADYLIKKIAVDSRGRFDITPANTVVASSTLEVIAQYQRLGFRILPVELADRGTSAWQRDTPLQLLDRLVQSGLAGRDWRTEPFFLTEVARATRRLYLRYGYGDLIVDLHRRPLLTADGDLTETRDYNAYVRAFDEGAERKYALIKELVVPGRIVDVGCCTGSLLRQMTLDPRLHESDFYGVELARPLFVECQHRKEQGAFASANVFFYQHDVAESMLFPPHSVNTFTTFSLTHELESYQGREVLERFIRMLAEQLAPGGRWLNVDVLGPDNKDDFVWMWLTSEDGRNDDWDAEFDRHDRQCWRQYIGGLSTRARFHRFCHDFRRKEGYRVEYHVETVGGDEHIRLRLADACEFLSKKDYVDNWHSEMHETFCFWDFSQWCAAVRHAGFVVHPSSYTFANEWIVRNRWEGKARLLRSTSGGLQTMPWPVTTMVLVAER